MWLQVQIFQRIQILKYNIRGLSVDRKSYEENTFKMSEMLDDATVTKLKNVEEFSVKEFPSFILGRCFTITKLRPVEERFLTLIKASYGAVYNK